MMLMGGPGSRPPLSEPSPRLAAQSERKTNFPELHTLPRMGTCLAGNSTVKSTIAA